MELRYIERTIEINTESYLKPVRIVEILQYRILGTEYFGGEPATYWSEWKDVPTVKEE